MKKSILSLAVAGLFFSAGASAQIVIDGQNTQGTALIGTSLVNLNGAPGGIAVQGLSSNLGTVTVSLGGKNTSSTVANGASLANAAAGANSAVQVFATNTSCDGCVFTAPVKIDGRNDQLAALGNASVINAANGGPAYQAMSSNFAKVNIGATGINGQTTVLAAGAIVRCHHFAAGRCRRHRQIPTLASTRPRSGRWLCLF